MEQIVVSECLEGKFGKQLKDAAGVFYSFGKFYKGDTSFAPGTKLEVDIYTTPKGNKYLNSVKAVETNTVSPVAVAPQKVEKPKFKAKDDTSMTKQEWKDKDRSQLLGGLCHDAAQLTLAAVTVGLKSEDVLKQFKEILDGVIKLREEVK